ncbi:hypothetical protein [Mycobacterium sp. HNNTM2301]|uniref:hypothetical protein n=1 Tax=Mycobacterium hainanense TaxID=3289775 RepID=UPI0035A7471B
MADFSRLSNNWSVWAPKSGLTNVTTSLSCGDCDILFKSDDYSVHLRDGDGGWVVDVVDDRGQRRNDVAKFSTFELVEKYLIWDWVTAARSDLASGALGASLYKLGYAPGVQVTELEKGNVELCLNGACATLVVGDATIFSHIMKWSVEDILSIATGGSS